MVDVNVKLAAFDFDDTIYIHPTHNYSKEDDLTLFSKIIAGDKDVYPEERFNPNIVSFMKYCYALNIPIAVCSRCSISEEAEYKTNLMRETLGFPVINLCVGDNAMKPVVLEAYARANRIKKSEILFVDDLWDNLESVERAGFKVASPSEIAVYKIKTAPTM